MGKASRKSISRREYDALIDVVREAREEADVPKLTLASQIGMHVAAYRKIEKRERLLDVIEFLDIAEALKRDPVTLFADFVKKVKETR